MAELHLLSPAGFVAGSVHAGIKTKDRLMSACWSPTARNGGGGLYHQQGLRRPGRGRPRARRRTASSAPSSSTPATPTPAPEARASATPSAMCASGRRSDRLRAGRRASLSSTGIIGHHLPMDKVEARHRRRGGRAWAIPPSTPRFLPTRFSRPTWFARRLRRAFKIGRETVTLAGVCKGSGMIGPRLGPPQATMLAYLTTDATIAAPLLRKLLGEAADRELQRRHRRRSHEHQRHRRDPRQRAWARASIRRALPKSFAAALNEVCQSLAYQIAADGEGRDQGRRRLGQQAPRTDAAAKAIARAIANSPLVKCAMHGNDPNWGRIVSAAGMCGVPFDPDRATLKLQGTVVFRNGHAGAIRCRRRERTLKRQGGQRRTVLPAGQSRCDRLDVRSVEGIRHDQRRLSHVIGGRSRLMIEYTSQPPISATGTDRAALSILARPPTLARAAAGGAAADSCAAYGLPRPSPSASTMRIT